jgi:hypothetical protein
MTSTVLWKRGKNYGIAVYVPKETILSKLSQHFYLDLVRELSDTARITSANTIPLHITNPQCTIPKCTYNLK